MRQNMPFIFGRDTTRPHGALAVPARELAASPEPLDQAVGKNILFDDRVSEERGEHFFEFTGRPVTGKQLRSAWMTTSVHSSQLRIRVRPICTLKINATCLMIQRPFSSATF